MVGQGLPVAQQVEEATDETGKRGAHQTPLSLLSPSLTAMTIKASISVIFPNLLQILHRGMEGQLLMWAVLTASWDEPVERGEMVFSVKRAASTEGQRSPPLHQ